MIRYPKDTDGNFCGLDNTASKTGGLDLSTKPYLYFMDPFDSNSEQVCVQSCPTATTIAASAQDAICKNGVTATTGTLASLITQKKCSAFVYASSVIMYRCAPSNFQALIDANLGNGKTSNAVKVILDSQEIASQIVSDFSRTWKWFLAFAGVAAVISIVWIVFMRFFTGFIVWFTLLMGLLSVDGMAVFLYFAWQNSVSVNKAAATVTTTMTREEQTYMGLFIALVVIAVALNLIVLFLRKRIRVAVQVVKESVLAVRAMPLMIFFPLIIFAAMLVTFAYWVVVELYLASATTNPSFFGITYDVAILKYLQWYNLFGLFWGLQFLSGLNQMTIAGAVGTWYWSRDKRALPSMPVLRSLGRAFRYHLGSIALGALVIAIVQLIRAVLYNAQRQLNASQNKVAKSILMCCQCCCACVEGIMKFLNKNAYIQIAVHGEPFCKSAKTAFQLLLRNAFRLLAIDSVTSFVLFLGRIFVASLCGCGSYYWFQYWYTVYEPVQLNYSSASVVVIMIIGYTVSSIFLFVFDMTVDTIFLCFCEDCEHNDGSEERPYYMSESLMLIANVKNLGSKVKKEGSKRKSVAKTSKVGAARTEKEKVVSAREAFVEEL